jgi:hypothetical protein
VDTDVLATGNGEIACGSRAAGQYNRIKLFAKLLAGDVNSNIHIATKLNAFGFKLDQTAIKVVLLHLEFRNAVTEKAARTVGTLKDDDIVAGTR